MRQLPDMLVLLFRLNQQNLDGIGTVFSSSRTDNSSRAQNTKAVIPVITPAWPFIDSTATGWLKKAQAIFKGSELSEISFDGGLSFGESIVSARTKQFSSKYLKPKILEDYESLALRIRSINTGDPLTIWNSLLRLRSSSTADTNTQIYLSLLRMRPNSLEYWQLLPELLYATPMARDIGALATSNSFKTSSDNARELLDFVAFECDQNNSVALYYRAFLFNFFNVKGRNADPISDLDKALELQPSFDIARAYRAQIYSNSGLLNLAMADYQKLLSSRSRKRLGSQNIYYELGRIHLRLLELPEARKYLMRSMHSGFSSWPLFYVIARLFYFEGDYPQAVSFLQRASQVQPDREIAKLFRAQVFAATGDFEEAKRVLDEIKSSGLVESESNLAEAYLAVAPDVTLSILQSTTQDINSGVATALRLVAEIFLDRDISVVLAGIPEEQLPLIPVGNSWDSFEIVAMTKWKYEQGLIRRESALKVLKLVVDDEQRKRITL